MGSLRDCPKWQVLQAALGVARPAHHPPRLVVPETHKRAVVTVADHSFLKTQKYLDQQQRADRENVFVEMLRFEQKYIQLAREYGIPMFTHEFRRSMARQDDLKKRGVSRAKAGQSPHNYGMAADIIHGVRGWNLDKKEWAVLGMIGKEAARKANVKIEWGGEWKFYDPAHWQLAGWRGRKHEYQPNIAVMREQAMQKIIVDAQRKVDAIT